MNLATKREEIARVEAKERQRERQRKGGETAGRGRPKENDSIPQNLAETNDRTENESRTEAARFAGISHETYRKAKQIKEWGVSPETEEKLRTDETTAKADPVPGLSRRLHLRKAMFVSRMTYMLE